MASQGNAINFGDLSTAQTNGSIGNSGVVSKGFITGQNPGSGPTQAVSGVSIVNGGTTTDFGNLALSQRYGAVCSDAHGGLNDGYQGTRPLPFNEAGGDRALTMGNSDSSYQSLIDFYAISSTGNANRFGNLTRILAYGSICASKTRAIMLGGDNASITGTNEIQYVEFSTEGNAADFGDLTAATFVAGGMANNTRGVRYGGATPSATNVMDYITMATTGNATDFGNASGSYSNASAASSNIRGVAWGNGSGESNHIDYITLATIGNASDFGNLAAARSKGASLSSSVRAIFGGGQVAPASPGLTNTMEYVTIATTGNASDFGDLLSAASYVGSGSNSVRGTFHGGGTPSYSNVIQYVTIDTTGNATDFGDLTAGYQSSSSPASNGHGGLVGG